MAIAGRQQARARALRAAMSLTRLCERQGRGERGRQILADALDPFTEGFDTPDLIDARALLGAL